MRYRTLRRKATEEFTEELNKAAQDGYSVISAGMIRDLNAPGYGWWAILQRDENAAPKTRRELLAAIKRLCAERGECDGCKYHNGHVCELGEEAKTPKDEFAELQAAAQKIKEYCNKTDCDECYFNTHDGYCEFTENAPDAWGILERSDDDV